MAPQVNDIIRVIAKMSFAGGDVQNVWHVKLDTVPGTPTNPTLLGDLAAVMDDIYDFIDSSTADEITFDTIEAYNLTRDEYVGESAWPTLTVGGATSSAPPQLAPLLLFSTDTLKSQGRKFLPPTGTLTIESDGTLVSSYLSLMAAFAAEVLTPGGWVAYGGDFGNFREIGSVFIPYVASIVRDFFATQRRRYEGRGS